jgi:polyisoprenyl-phosphate glycosyltransferase
MGAEPVSASLDTPPAPAVNSGNETAPYVSIVLPCYNEQGHVVAEVERICAAMDASGYDYELLAIDDASTDDTLARLYEVAERFPRMEVVHFHRNGGSGVVRRIGTERARGKIVVWTDADMTYPNERIPEFVQFLEKDETVDQVVGARTSEQGTYKLLRVPAKWLIRKLAERLTGARIPDLNSGLRAFRREVSLPYLRLLPPGFSCVTTITVAFLANHHEVYYVPIEYSKRAGRSKFKFITDAYRYILQVLRMTMYFNPLKVLMPLALFLLGLGVAKGIFDLAVHPFLISINTVLIFVTGLIIASMALLADLIVRSRELGADVRQSGDGGVRRARSRQARGERGDHLSGGELPPGEFQGLAAQRQQRVPVTGQPQQRGGQGLRVARRHQDGRVAEKPPLGRGVRRDDRASGRGSLEYLVGHHPPGLLAGAEDAEADVVIGHQLGEFPGGYPVQPAHRLVGRGGRPGVRLVLAAPDHRDLHRRAGEPAERGPDDGRPLERGEQAVEHHPQRLGGIGRRVARDVGRRVARDVGRRVVPGRRGTYRHDHRPLPVPLGQRGQVLLGVNDDDVRGAQRGGVDHPQQDLAGAAVQPPVASGIAGSHQMIEHDRNPSPAEEQAGQVNVEMAEISHHHRVRGGHPPGQPGQRGPAPGEPGQQRARAPRAGQHVHPGRGVQSERDVALRHVETAGGQPLRDRRDPRVHGAVIGAEDCDAHDVRTLARQWTLIRYFWLGSLAFLEEAA